MRDPVEIAKAFLRESQDDLESAKLLLEHRRFSKCLQHAQGALEKALKAALVLRGQVVSQHRVCALFLETFQDKLTPELTSAPPRLTELSRRMKIVHFGAVVGKTPSAWDALAGMFRAGQRVSIEDMLHEKGFDEAGDHSRL